MILFRAGKQERKVRAVWIGSWIALYLAAYFTLEPFFESGEAMSPDLWRDRMALAVVLIALCGSVVAGMSVYVRCYVTRLELEEGGPSLSIRTLGLRRERVRSVSLTAIECMYFRESELADAPWWTLRVEGRRLPFIVDAQGEVENLTLFVALLLGALPEALSSTGTGAPGQASTGGP